MRRVFLVSTLFFWLAVGGFWAASVLSPVASRAPAAIATNTYTLAEVGRHASDDDCWMAIGGQVYDLTAYLPEHPTKPAVIVPWCGKDASAAYRTKNKERAHSPAADQLLRGYHRGVLGEPR